MIKDNKITFESRFLSKKQDLSKLLQEKILSVGIDFIQPGLFIAKSQIIKLALPLEKLRLGSFTHGVKLQSLLFWILKEEHF